MPSEEQLPKIEPYNQENWTGSSYTHIEGVQAEILVQDLVEKVYRNALEKNDPAIFETFVTWANASLKAHGPVMEKADILEISNTAGLEELVHVPTGIRGYGFTRIEFNAATKKNVEVKINAAENLFENLTLFVRDLRTTMTASGVSEITPEFLMAKYEESMDKIRKEVPPTSESVA